MTTDNKLNIYSTRSTQLIKAGLILDGICMMASNGECSLLCTLSMKSVVQLFKVKDVQALDSCVLVWSISIADILKLKSSLLAAKPKSSLDRVTDTKVYVDNIIVANEGTVIVFLTDKSRFEYDEKARTWRELSLAFEWPQDAVTDSYAVTTSSGHPLNKLAELQREMDEPKNDSVAALIAKLERQSLG